MSDKLPSTLLTNTDGDLTVIVGRFEVNISKQRPQDKWDLSYVLDNNGRPIAVKVNAEVTLQAKDLKACYFGHKLPSRRSGDVHRSRKPKAGLGRKTASTTDNLTGSARHRKAVRWQNGPDAGSESSSEAAAAASPEADEVADIPEHNPRCLPGDPTVSLHPSALHAVSRLKQVTRLMEQHPFESCDAEICLICNFRQAVLNKDGDNDQSFLERLEPLRKVVSAKSARSDDDDDEPQARSLECDEPTTAIAAILAIISFQARALSLPCGVLDEEFRVEVEHTWTCTACGRESKPFAQSSPALTLKLPSDKRLNDEMSMTELWQHSFAIKKLRWCPTCKPQTEHTRSTKVIRWPDTLLIRLSRFSTANDKQVKSRGQVPYPRELTHSHFPCKDSVGKYALSTVICHSGPSLSSNSHFAMYASSPEGAVQYFDYDTEMDASLQDMLHPSAGKQPSDDPILLIYERT